MKNQYLTYDLIESHKVQFKALKDSNEVGELPKLTVETDVLSWVDTAKKYLLKLLGQDNSPLEYLTRDNVIVPATTDDLIPGKCYLLTHKSLVGEMVGWKDHSGSCVETDKVILFGHLEKALKDEPYELCLQPHEGSKDGLAVMESLLQQHGGNPKWEKAHTSKTKALDNKWNSTGAAKTLTNHIASFRVAMVDIKRCCLHTDQTPPTEREQVLKLIASIMTSEPLLIAHILQVNADPGGLGANFEATAIHLMLAEPIETK